jgi:Uncharacterized protein conserved in bacteria (DUF2188)
MTLLHYQIVQHDGGWTYKVGEVFAETFPTREAAEAAAKRAAGEQRVPTPPHDIQFEDEKGRWHTEHSDGTPPDTDVG